LDIFLGVTEVIGRQPLLKYLAAKYPSPIGDRENVIFAERRVERPFFDVFFRPEEVHPASIERCRAFSPFGERGHHITDSRWWVNFENIFIVQTDTDNFPTIETATLNENF